jgi:hypothetical protein
MWLECSNKVLDVSAHESMDFLSDGCYDGYEKFPLSFGHGLLASNARSQLDPSISTK